MAYYYVIYHLYKYLDIFTFERYQIQVNFKYKNYNYCECS